MKTVILATTLCIAALAGAAAQKGIVEPFEVLESHTLPNGIDTRVHAELKKAGIRPAHPCSDQVFLRRVYLDVIGTLPEATEIRNFIADKDPAKRAALIDVLLEREEFADYWALKWSDLLRVKAEFPINLWPNAVQAYHQWIRASIRANKPYDQFARELLTSSGSNFRVPPVNFYRALQGQEPGSIAEAAALTFMGTRLEDWPEADRANLEMFFSRVAYKPTSEWKEEIVCLDPSAVEPLDAVLPNGKKVHIQPGEDPRKVFADWLITGDNPWFTRNIANRMWAWLMGRGIIHETDDIRKDNPPSNPDLLAYIEKEMIASGYDMRHVFRLILNSRTYQQSSIPQSEDPKAEALFAHYIVRRLDAEVMIDALCWITGTKESYESLIPEPFTYIPEDQRTIALADGSITSQFLEVFGRPARDTGLESERNNNPTDAQRLHMLNSTHIQRKLDTSGPLNRLVKNAKGKRDVFARNIYLRILSRYPTDAELDTAGQYLNTKGLSRKQAAVDLAWALINSKEFQYRH